MFGIKEMKFTKGGVVQFNSEDCYQSEYPNNLMISSEDKCVFVEDLPDMTYMF
jgi:hypothetical protein